MLILHENETGFTECLPFKCEIRFIGQLFFVHNPSRQFIRGIANEKQQV